MALQVGRIQFERSFNSVANLPSLKYPKVAQVAKPFSFANHMSSISKVTKHHEMSTSVAIGGKPLRFWSDQIAPCVREPRLLPGYNCHISNCSDMICSEHVQTSSGST